MYDATIYGCYCPMQGYIACSAEEALSNEGSWMEDFLKHRDNYIDSLNYRRLFPKVSVFLYGLLLSDNAQK